MIRILWFLLLVMAPSALAQQSLYTNELLLSPTTLPAYCSQGALRTSSANGSLYQCNNSNSWSVAGGGGGGGTWGSITGTLSNQTDLYTALGLKAPLASPTFTGTVTGTFSGNLTGNVTGNASGTAANVTGTSNSTLTTLSALSLPGSQVSGAVSSSTTATNLSSGSLGSVPYQSSSGTTSLLNGNTTSTKNYLVQTGTGSVSAAPSWGTIAAGDVPTLNQNTTGTAANVTGTSNATLTTLTALTTASSLASVGTITSGTWSGTAIATTKGGTGQTSVITSPAASTYAGWDANKNMNANSFVPLSQSIATAAGTTTLTVSSPMYTTFTGSTTQTCILPVVSTLALGTPFFIANNSTGVVTVQSSGANTIQAMAAGTIASFTNNAITGTTASVWNYLYSGGTPTFSGLTVNGVAYATSSTAIGTAGTGTTGQVLTSNGSGSAPTMQNHPTASYWQGVHPETMYWTLGTASTQSDFTSSGATPAITQLSGSGITVTQASGSLPGITFTPASSTAVYQITATFACDPQTPGLSMGVFLVGGSNNISGVSTNISNGGAVPMTLSGIFAPASTSAQTVKLQGYSTSTGGNLGFLPGTGFPGAIYWTVLRIL